MKRILLTLLIPLLSIGCDSVNGPESPDVDLEFGIQRLAHEPAFLVTRDGDDITVRGFYQALCSPYTGSARASISHDGILTLRVIGRIPPSGACRDVIVEMGYQATVSDIDAHVEHVRVIHEWPDANREPETVYTDENLVER